MPPRATFTLLILVLALLLAACTAPPPVIIPSAGTLVVSVNGLPADVDADITVVGPVGFSATLSTSQVFNDLEPGTYRASASAVTDGSDSYSPTISGSPGQVSDAMGAVIEIDYTLDLGSLEVTVDGLPAGVDAAVTVIGANGFSTALTASATLTDLEPGLYALGASSVVTDDPIVIERYLFETTVISVEVTSNTTAQATIAYSVQPGTGKLWMPDADTLIAGYSRGQLTAGGSPVPAVTLSGLSNPESLAFDGDGNLWVGQAGAGIVQKFAVADLASDRIPTATVTITGGNPWGIAFDSVGNLWVANRTLDTLTKYRSDQLLVNGNPTPAATLSSDGSSLDDPVGIAFDAAGNLWVTNEGSNTIEKFAPGQLASDGTPTPRVTIGADATGDLARPFGIAFDSDGDLWVANAESSTVLAYRGPQLASSGTPKPAVTLNSKGGSLDAARGIAFDHDGGLWVVSLGSTSLVRLAPAQLASSGSPVPDITLTISLADPAPVAFPAFNPPPGDLPLNAP